VSKKEEVCKFGWLARFVCAVAQLAENQGTVTLSQKLFLWCLVGKSKF
jgi:hypothetical protein